MFDAWGKIPSGILAGNQYEFGSFDECLGVNYNDNRSTFIGQYCLAQVKVILPEEFARVIPVTEAIFKTDLITLKQMVKSRTMSADVSK